MKVAPADDSAAVQTAPGERANAGDADTEAATDAGDRVKVDKAEEERGPPPPYPLQSQGRPAKLPPLDHTGGQSFALTGGTFTLNGPHAGGGIATFEFEALPRGTLPTLMPTRTFGSDHKQTVPAAASSSGQNANTANQPPPQKVEAVEESWSKGVYKVVQVTSLVIGMTVLGNIIFSVLEKEAEEESRDQYASFLLAHKARYNITEAHFAELVEFIGTPVDFDPDSFERNWGNTNRNSLLFTFTILSTVGYGNFAPTTDGGKIFLMCFALIGIPIVGACVGILATKFLGVLEWYAVLHMDEVRGAFEQFDKDDSGHLNEEEFYNALEELEIFLTPKEVRRVMRAVDSQGDMQIDLDEFKAVAALLNLPLGKAARARVRLTVSVFGAFAWMILGAFVYVELEGWTFLDSLYFCVVTLTTIGLGDFVPVTKPGVTFHYFFCVVGLGLVAILLTAIFDFISALHLETRALLTKEGRDELKQQVAAEAEAAAATILYEDDEAATADVSRREKKAHNRKLVRQKSLGVKGMYDGAASAGNKATAKVGENLRVLTQERTVSTVKQGVRQKREP
jgi:hypothetical protein